jgi:hypothetical protein
VDHAVDIAFEADEQAELGLVLDFAFDFGAGRDGLCEHFPRILERLLEAERNAALVGVDFENDHIDFLAGRQDLADGCTFFLVQDISDTWIRPSMPGSSSTNAP